MRARLLSHQALVPPISVVSGESGVLCEYTSRSGQNLLGVTNPIPFSPLLPQLDSNQ